MSYKRVVVTGMSINTPLGDTVEEVGMNMLAGKSAISYWKGIDTSRIYSKIGGDLSSYDVHKKLETFSGKVTDEMYSTTKHLFKQVSRSTQLSVLMSLDAYLDSGLLNEKIDPYGIGVICGGHELNIDYLLKEYDIFQEEPDFIDGLGGLTMLDTDHSSSVSEILDCRALAYSVGGVCATGGVAILTALCNIQVLDLPVMIVLAPVNIQNSFYLQQLCIMNAISYNSFNTSPEHASRPYDKRREGFVPCEGGGVLIVEELKHAKARGAKIYAEILGVNVNSDANHLGNPSQVGQTRMMEDLFKHCKVSPSLVDYISAHATSTELGDITEIQSIKDVFGRHADDLFINAPKSLLGHTLFSAHIVESVVGIWQMNRGIFHQSHNIDELDERVDIDVCADTNVKHDVNIFLNNSFGMGGINSATLFKKNE